MVDYKISNNKGFRYIFIIIEIFCKYLWCRFFQNQSAQTKTNEFSNNLTTSKRKPIKLESDRGAEWYNSVFQNFVKSKFKQHYSRITDQGPSIDERLIQTVRNLLKKPVFDKGNADWSSELSSITEKYDNSIHHSRKMTPVQASKNANEKKVYSDLQHERKKPIPKFILGDLVRTADNKRVFSEGDSTNFSYKLYKINEVIHDTLPSYRIDHLPERYNQKLLLPSNSTLDENNQVMKKLNLIQ